MPEYSAGNRGLEPYMLYGDRENRVLEQPALERTARDLDYLKSLYPGRMKQLQGFVGKACDKVDYKNSPIYDEYPDRVMIDRMCAGICHEIEACGMDSKITGPAPFLENGSQDTGNMEVEEVEIYELSHIQPVSSWGPPSGSRPGPPHWGPPPGPPHWGPPPGPPHWGPPPGPPHWGPPPGPPPWGPPPGPQKPENGWMNDIVRILLLNEIHHRRCRTGFC